MDSLASREKINIIATGQWIAFYSPEKPDSKSKVPNDHRAVQLGEVVDLIGHRSSGLMDFPTN